jgi:RNA recognition motif-containing protein
MQNSSSGGDRNRNSNSRSRGGSRSGSRSGGGGDRNRRSGSRSGGDSRRDGGSRSESSSSRPPRGSRSFDNEPEIIRRSTAPKPTGFQKFIKIITFGLVDLAAKKPAPKKPVPKSSSERSSAKSGDKPEKRERRAPLLVEPTTPRLYVGNLSYDATGEDLTTLFSAYGTVAEAAIVTQPGSSRSKGFAFVEMGSVEEAKAAAAALNDKDFQGRQMLVTGAKSEGRTEGERAPRAPREGRSGEGRSEGRSGEGRSEGRSREGRSEGRGRGERGRSGDRDLIEKPTRQVKPLQIEVVTSPSLTVTHLNAEASEIDLTDLFAGIGTIQHREETSAEGAVTKTVRVDLADTAEAQKAVELLDGKSFMGHQIRVTGVKDGNFSAPASPAVTEQVEAVEAAEVVEKVETVEAVEAEALVETVEAPATEEIVEIADVTEEPENQQA